MKSPLQTSLYISMFPLKTTNASSAIDSNQTPYLRAILSGTSKSMNSASVITMADSDRAAASRYIKESCKIKRN